MPSTFTWLDYSEHERRKMLDVIDLFGEKTTRDELGLGGVRDAFADMLFPGTTTIQTVAKYFLFVPWMYLDLERKQFPSSKVAERARKFEINLAKTLGDADGVIGKRAKDSLKRLPSSVYWQGLMAWGIRVYPKSQSEYHKSLDLHYARLKGRDATATDFDGEPEPSETEELISGASGDENASPQPSAPALVGLYAKLYVLDYGREASVFTGSANATHAAFNRNVEFLTELRGKKGKVGVAPRIFLKKLVADVLDRIDLHEGFNPRADYQLTIGDVELTTIERHAAAGTSVDEIELEL